MKKVLISLVYLSLLLVFPASACKKQNLPSGDHSFYCYIDGELFVPKGDPNFTTSPYVEPLTFYVNQENFRIRAFNSKYHVMINIVNWGVGTHYLSQSEDYYNHSTNHARVGVNQTWYVSKPNSGKVTFTEASLDGNIKGTFEFTLYNENDESDVIHVTGGHFDD